MRFLEKRIIKIITPIIDRLINLTYNIDKSNLSLEEYYSIIRERLNENETKQNKTK